MVLIIENPKEAVKPRILVWGVRYSKTILGFTEYCTNNVLLRRASGLGIFKPAELATFF
jgi:hypothetical protein